MDNELRQSMQTLLQKFPTTCDDPSLPGLLTAQLFVVRELLELATQLPTDVGKWNAYEIGEFSRSFQNRFGSTFLEYSHLYRTVTNALIAGAAATLHTSLARHKTDSTESESSPEPPPAPGSTTSNPPSANAALFGEKSSRQSYSDLIEMINKEPPSIYQQRLKEALRSRFLNSRGPSPGEDKA